MASSQPRYDSTASSKANAERITRFSGQQYRSESYQIFSEEKINGWASGDPVYRAAIAAIPTAKVASTSDLQVRAFASCCVHIPCLLVPSQCTSGAP